MTWVLIIYSIGINGIMFVGDADPNRFTSQYECEEYAAYVQFHIEKTQSSISRTTFECVPDKKA